MIKENGCFVAHLLDISQKELYECCGTKSGRDGDKLKEHNVRIADGKKVNAGVIEGCPVAIECTVVDSIMTGSHEMFVGKLEYVSCNKNIANENGAIMFSKIDYF